MELSLLLSQLSSSWLNLKPLAFAIVNTCGFSQSEAPRTPPTTDHRTSKLLKLPSTQPWVTSLPCSPTHQPHNFQSQLGLSSLSSSLPEWLPECLNKTLWFLNSQSFLGLPIKDSSILHPNCLGGEERLTLPYLIPSAFVSITLPSCRKSRHLPTHSLYPNYIPSSPTVPAIHSVLTSLFLPSVNPSRSHGIFNAHSTNPYTSK